MSKTTLYICADGTLTYGPYGGRDKIVPQALPIGFLDNPQEAESIITLVGRAAYDVPEADAHFQEQLKGRRIKEGYGPTYRYYYSGQEWERNNVETIFAVSKTIESWIAHLRKTQ